MGTSTDVTNVTEEERRDKEAMASSTSSPISSTFTNTLGMRFHLLPAGTFMMGSPESEKERGRYSDEVQHRVTLSRPFYMGVYLVTQGEWERVMGDNPAGFEGDRNPVEQVSWEDCQEFIAKLNSRYKDALSQQLGSGWEYSFPTEAEWEYACRAGTTGAYGGTGDLDSMGWYEDNSDSGTHAVGAKRPNSWGLYDMHGNVWEWCSDWYGSYPSGSVTDPKGPNSGEERGFRGGSWYCSIADCRSASRYCYDPSFRSYDLGLRLAVHQVK